MATWKGKSVLIVDDNETAAAEVESVATEVGLKVVGVARSGLDALEKLKEQIPDFVSLDIIMPEMDGIECYRRIRNSYPSVEVFFVSALSNESRLKEVYSDTISENAFVSKPITIESLTVFLSGGPRESDGGDEVSQVPPPPPV